MSQTGFYGLVLSNMGQNPPDEDSEKEGDVALAQPKAELKRPSMYRVVLLNDDFTPMNFVVDVLKIFFNMDEEKATQIMLLVHTQGKATCGVYTRDVAETKAEQVTLFAQEHQHPLLCQIEQI